MAEVEEQLSIADLKAALPDNIRRLIRPVHFRDIVETFKPDRAQIYISAAAETTIVSAGVYVKAAGTTAFSSSPTPHNFNGPEDNRLRYLGSSPRVVCVDGTVSMTSAASNITLQIAFAKNGVVVPETQVRRRIGTGSDVGAMPITGMFELDTNDYVELWISNATNNGNITVETMNLTALGAPM
jgi:hypothetical protein